MFFLELPQRRQSGYCLHFNGYIFIFLKIIYIFSCGHVVTFSLWKHLKKAIKIVTIYCGIHAVTFFPSFFETAQKYNKRQCLISIFLKSQKGGQEEEESKERAKRRVGRARSKTQGKRSPPPPPKRRAVRQLWSCL